jgi:hypothetical protein
LGVLAGDSFSDAILALADATEVSLSVRFLSARIGAAESAAELAANEAR